MPSNDWLGDRKAKGIMMKQEDGPWSMGAWGHRYNAGIDFNDIGWLSIRQPKENMRLSSRVSAYPV